MMFDSVVEAIAYHAMHSGSKTAVIADAGSVTYEELWLKIKQFAAVLLKKGIQSGDKIILSADYTVQFVEVYFAAHWLGAVNVVVEKTASMQSVAPLQQSLSPRFVILNQAEAETYDTLKVSDDITSKGSFTSDSLADILYTTGTTGVPKGVMLSHRNEVAGAHNVINGGEMVAKDVNLLTMPLHHAFGLTTLRAVLYKGGTAVLQDGVASIRKTVENIRKNSCNCIYMVPAALRVLYFQTGQRLDLLLGDIEKLEFCTAPLDKKMRGILSEQLKGVRLYNSYGATESARSVYMRLDQNIDKAEAIGRAVQGVFIRIVDEKRKEMNSSRQNVGHLAVCGDMNMLGYYDDPVMTGQVLDQGIFYSEDLGYMDEEGYIYLAGRNNDVINIGGEKVSPFEIENTAMEHVGVRECACIGVKDPQDVLGDVPVLYITEEAGSRVDASELHKYLEDHLENYKIPYEIIVIDEIPKNHIGKIDRAGLKKIGNCEKWKDESMEGAYLITGATGGVGQAVVKEFSENGKKMVLLGRDEEKLRKLKEETESVLTCISYNLGDIKSLETVFRDCLSQGIKFQGLVHCAGINQGMPIKINDIDVMDQMMRINLYSFVELGKYFTRKKYAFDESSIVAVSSMAAIGNAKGMCMYSATKAALNSTVKTMSRELISRKTRVNAIMPGYLEKPMAGEKDFLGEEEFKKIQPFGRIESQDVAKLASFLSSGAARFITGALIPIGGGQII